MIMLSEKIMENVQNILILIEKGIITEEKIKEILGSIKKDKDGEN